MKKRILAMLVCAVVLSAAGCGGQSKDSASADTAQNAEAAEAEEFAEDAAFADTSAEVSEPEEVGNTQLSVATEVYESEDGWSVHYNSEVIDVEEGYDSVRFTYNQDAAATNRIEISYIPNTSTDIVLADKTEGYDPEDLVKSEGYFAGQADLWSFSVDEANGSLSRRGFTALEHNEGVLLVERRSSIESDEERGLIISDTMAAILDTFEFSDHDPQEEYDYIPGKYMLVQESEEETSGQYPAYVALGQNHTGRLGYEKPVNIIWYCRDSIIKEDSVGGPSHYYSIEGEALYLQIGEEWVEYRKDLGAATSIESTAAQNKHAQSFRTYENQEGWMVYYDERLFNIQESWHKVDFIYGSPEESSDMLEIRYISNDSTENVLENELRNYDSAQAVWSEGYVGGGKEAWGFTVTVPAEDSGAGVHRKLTAVEHNDGVLLFDRITAEKEENAEAAKIGKACDGIISTFLFTDHEPQSEYDNIPGKYMLNDKKLQRSASNYPAYVRLNKDHTGLFGGDDEKDVIWYSRNGVIKENLSGATYSYYVDDETLYLQMEDEWVEFDKED